MSIFLPFWGYTFNNRSFKKRLRCITENSLFKSCLPWNFFPVKNELLKKRESSCTCPFRDLDISAKYNFYAYNNLILGLSFISIQIGHVGIRSCNWIQSGTHATMNSTFSTVLYLSTYSLLVKKKLQFEDVWRVFLLHLFRGGE